MMSQGVDVDLPEASSDPLSADKEPLVITIDKSGSVFISELKVEVNYLQEKLRKILEGRKNKEVFFKADKDVAYGIVIQVMAEIKGAGIEKLGMITAPPSEPSEKTS
jgi:biopolymer transport protein TolR